MRVSAYTDSWRDDALVLLAEAETSAVRAFPELPASSPEVREAAFSRAIGFGNTMVAHTSQGALLGYMAFAGPFHPFHGDHTGAWAPVHACVIAGKEVDRVFTALFRAASDQPALTAVDTWSISAFAYNAQLNRALTMNGFGARVADAYVAIDHIAAADPPPGISITAQGWQQAIEVLALKQALDLHLTQSPVYMTALGFTESGLMEISQQRESQFYVARHDDQPVGFLEFTADGENYLTRAPHMVNICGAYVHPDYRRQGIMKALLAHAAADYRHSGIHVIGVDYETINPEARRMWETIFTPYILGWERRRDRKPGAA